MIVTDRDAVIADFAIHSYRRVKCVSFKLIVYSNWMSTAAKAMYFPRWRALPYVVLVANDWQTEDQRPDARADSRLEGPYEKGFMIWDRELARVSSPFYATVDADFEILDGRFVPVMLKELQSNPQLAGMSQTTAERNPSTTTRSRMT